jgi:hypothetical protein
LKSFLNGGTYDEGVLTAYDGTATTRDQLQSKVIDLRLELKTARRSNETAAGTQGSKLPEDYRDLTLRDLLDQDSFNEEDIVNKYHSAFRIIGQIEKVDCVENERKVSTGMRLHGGGIRSEYDAC